MKKIVALILALALMLGAMPFALAAECVHEGDCCGDNPISALFTPCCDNYMPYYKQDSSGKWIAYCMGCGTVLSS